MKGEAHRALDRVHAVKLGGTLLHLSPDIPELNLGAYILLVDADKNPSEPIRLPGAAQERRVVDEVVHFYKQDILACESPDTEINLMDEHPQFKLGCHALRGLSLEENISHKFFATLSPEQLADQLKRQARQDSQSIEELDVDSELRSLLNGE